MVEPDWKARAEQLLEPVRKITEIEIKENFGETAVDILKGHFAHLVRQDARSLLMAIAYNRVRDFKTRFSAGGELPTQPLKIFRDLGYDPTSDVAMGRPHPTDTLYEHSAFITVYEIERAVGSDRLKVDYLSEIAVARTRSNTLSQAARQMLEPRREIA